jgi:transcription initiation factor IIE alpha subunit
MVMFEVSHCNDSEESGKMKTFYMINSEETGEIVLKKRRIAKALRRWLRENGVDYSSAFYIS